MNSRERLGRFIVRSIWVGIGVIFGLGMMFGLIVTAIGEELIPPTPEEAEDIKKWIPAMCCRTNNCCMKVHESALVSLPKNEIRVVTTGQVLPRTGWSQDKNTWRCACDWQRDGSWLVHPHAHTRCVFDHPNGY